VPSLTPRRTSARRHSAPALIAVLVIAILALGAPGAMAASLNEGSAFGELTQGGQETGTTTTTRTTAPASTESSSNSSRTILIASAAAIVLLCAIGFVIVRDARRVAPAGDGELTEGRSGRDPAVAMRKRRAKAKAARRQRKRNR
jgi:hypothetical protein